MKKLFRKNSFKITSSFIMILVGITTIFSGTLAGLSAMYLWKSNFAQTGTFPHQNRTFNLDLFDSEYILPGDNGSAVFSVPDMAGYTPRWAVTESNDGNIPVVFYIGNTYYSKRVFPANLYIVNANNEYILCSQISNNKADLLVKIKDGATLNWVWPEHLYVKNGEDYIISESTEATEYETKNAELCAPMMPFDESLATALSSVTVNGDNEYTPAGYVTSDNGVTPITANSLNGITADNKIVCKDGWYYFNDIAIPVIRNGKAITPNANTIISEQDYYAFVMTKSELYAEEALLAGIGEEFANRVKISEVKYVKSVTGDTITLTPADADTATAYIVKVYPMSGISRPGISISFSAIVSSND